MDDPGEFLELEEFAEDRTIWRFAAATGAIAACLVVYLLITGTNPGDELMAAQLGQGVDLPVAVMLDWTPSWIAASSNMCWD